MWGGEAKLLHQVASVRLCLQSLFNLTYKWCIIAKTKKEDQSSMQFLE